jgi:hypothetical protein
MPPWFGIAYFIEENFTLRHSPHRLMVHTFPYALTLDLYIRKFVISLLCENSHHIQFFSRATYPLAYLSIKMASAFVLSNLPELHTPCSVKHDARRSIGGMVSGYMVPSFPSLDVKLRLHLVIFCFSRCSALIAELVVLLR